MSELRSARSLTIEAVRERIDAYLRPVVKEVEPLQPALFTFIDKFIEDAPQRVNIETGKHIDERTIKKYRITVKVLREFAGTYTN